MNVNEFISQYKNHPVLFIGSGFSHRYLKKTYTWDSLLSKVCFDLCDNNELYFDIKASSMDGNSKCLFESVASEIEKKFNSELENDRNGKFKEINDIFYQNMQADIKLSRFKIYIARLLNSMEIKDDMEDEISDLKKIRKNISSIITTNYDKFIECVFDFNPLIGNNILLSNPYGSVYKIHGCVDDISKIIITTDDYNEFNKRYDLIRAQLLSLFIHNPIIFLGYGIGDENIKKVLKTIFTYIPQNTDQADIIRRNFLLVEYQKDSYNLDIADYDVVIDSSTIRINKIKTDNFRAIYTALANLNLPISAMDVRKVQSVVKEIYSGGKIKVCITEDIDELRNSDRILAIGSSKTISYSFKTICELIQDYFKIIEESNSAILLVINKQNITTNQYFPIYGFGNLCSEIEKLECLKNIQSENLKNYISNNIKEVYNNESINSIIKDTNIAPTNKHKAIIYCVAHENIELDDFGKYLIEGMTSEQKKDTNYRRLLCLYDIKKYGSFKL